MFSSDNEIFSTENWVLVFFSLAAFYSWYLFGKKSTTFFRGSKDQYYGWILVTCTWLYIGTRPFWAYGDTWLYTKMFELVQTGRWESLSGENLSEWAWSSLEYLCIDITTVDVWLTIIAFFYVVGMAWAAWRWMPRHFTMTVFFMFTAFSFWPYAVNGIRNGMATSLALIALSYVKPEYRKNWAKLWPAIVLMIIAAGTHKTVYLVGVAAIFAFLIPSKKIAFWIWGGCLLMSPVSSNVFLAVGESFIEDKRFVGYGDQNVSEEIFNRIGWRWDFILYSALPVVLGYYVLIKRKLYDWTYVFLLNIYLYCNAAWMLINEVAYSNRFAYISWFLYPFLIVMPLIKFKIWRNQYSIAGIGLLGCLIFTIILIL